MKQYIVKTKFVFSGHFLVNAANQAEARQIVENHCGLVIGGDIHSTVDDVDWDFKVHPEKKITNIKKRTK